MQAIKQKSQEGKSKSGDDESMADEEAGESDMSGDVDDEIDQDELKALKGNKKTTDDQKKKRRK